MTNEELALKMLGMDRTKEILNLWNEVVYLRHILTNVLKIIPNINEKLLEEWIEESRKESGTFIKNRFPLLNTSFENDFHLRQ